MTKELESAHSILWMMVELKDHGRFSYSEWADRFRQGESPRQPRDDRKFHHHLKFLKDNVLPEFQPRNALPLKVADGYYSAITKFDDETFGYLSGENLLPFLHGLSQLRTLVPFPSSELEDQLVELLDVDPSTLGPVLYKNRFHSRFDPQFLTTFLDAIHQEKKLLVVPKAPRKACELTPLHLVNYDGAWYLFGLAERLEQYNLSRIDGLEVSESSAASIPVAKRNQLRASLQTTFGAFLAYDWTGDGQGELVTVRYTGSALSYAEERYDQAVRGPEDAWFTVEHQEKALDVTLRVHNHSEILSEVLRWGADAQALRPEAFRNEWIKRLEAVSLLLNTTQEATIPGQNSE